MSVIHRGIALCGTGASVLSAGPSKPEKLLYSTLHLETDSSFTGLARRKWDWVSFFSRCLGPARLGVGYRVTLPGENTITAGVKYTQRQACCTVVSVVNSSCLESRFWEWDIHYQSKRHQTFVFTNKDHGICTFFFLFVFFKSLFGLATGIRKNSIRAMNNRMIGMGGDVWGQSCDVVGASRNPDQDWGHVSMSFLLHHPPVVQQKGPGTARIWTHDLLAVKQQC